MPDITHDDAYRKGRAASKRTTTCDLEAAETRFLRRYGHNRLDAFVKGWIEWAAHGSARRLNPDLPAPPLEGGDHGFDR